MATATEWMTCGGDARLLLDPRTGLNRYHSAPRPADVVAFASSTANDISPAAHAHVEGVLGAVAPDGELSPKAYRRALERARDRLRAAYALPADVAIVFAPSGTDLEYVALACAAEAQRARGVLNVLLGADEVGSGCIHSAHGRFFADETALGHPAEPGRPVKGLENTAIADVPVRDAAGVARPSPEIAREMVDAAGRAAADGRAALVHVVHGSKTGLVLPHPQDLEDLGRCARLVIDACQARITSAAIADYLHRGAIVFVTGSKFMGGPPFSGFALIPAAVAAGAEPLPEGFAQVFRRAEWPAGWPGADLLPDEANLGLLLRLEAALFELERFQRLAMGDVERVVLAFHAAVRRHLIKGLGARRIAPYPPGEKEEADTHPVEMRTLSTLDISALPGGRGFDDARRAYERLLAHGVRLGQPVKCVPDGRGGWGGTLRVGISMPQVVELAGLDDEALRARLDRDLGRVADAVRAALSENDSGTVRDGWAKAAAIFGGIDNPEMEEWLDVPNEEDAKLRW